MKSYTALVMVAFFASMGLPGFSGFIGEVMIFLGAFTSSSANGLLPKWMAFASVLGLLLSAAYYAWTLQRMFLGTFSIKIRGISLPDLNKREYLLLLPLAMVALGLGIFPQPLLDIISPFAINIVEEVMKLKP